MILYPHCSEILKENIVDVCQFCLKIPADVENVTYPDLLWAAVISQLENGEVALKTVFTNFLFL